MSIRKPKTGPTPSKLEEVFGESKKLLVGTVFSKDDPLQRDWLDLQLKFLSATTHSFDHVAILYSNEDSEYFSSRTEIVRLKPFTSDNNSKAHVTGLNFLAEMFRSRRSIYQHFLFLDSDAFPIRCDWQTVLEQKMKNHSIALAIRTEDLETRFHASIVYSKVDALNRLNFNIGLVGKDLLGDPESDINIGNFQSEDSGEVFSLVRSNQVNYHPALFGIYYDCFYHHCCGSGRVYNLRSRDYWDIFCDKDINVNSYTEALMSNPNDFISKLAGWSPERYAKI